MYSSLPDSPQRVGDLIGLGVRLCRRNLPLVFKVLLVPTVFTTLAGIIFQWVFSYGVSNVAETKNIASAVGLFVLWAIAALVFFGAWWILGMRLLALTRLVLGFSQTFEQAWQFVLSRKWAVLGVYFLGVVMFFLALSILGVGVFAAAIASGPVGSGASVAVVLTMFVAFWIFCFVIVVYLIASHLSFCVLACEDVPVPTIISRSLQLVFGNLKRSIAFGALFALTILIISCPLSLPIAVMTFSDAFQHQMSTPAAFANGYKPPLYLLVAAQTWESVIGLVLRPMVMFCFGLFYYDLLLRREGLDIKRRLSLLETRAL